MLNDNLTIKFTSKSITLLWNRVEKPTTTTDAEGYQSQNE